MKQLAAAGDQDKITSVIYLLTTEFTYSPQANHRKVFFYKKIWFQYIGHAVWCLNLFIFFLKKINEGRIDRISSCNCWVDFWSSSASWGEGLLTFELLLFFNPAFFVCLSWLTSWTPSSWEVMPNSFRYYVSLYQWSVFLYLSWILTCQLYDQGPSERINL